MLVVVVLRTSGKLCGIHIAAVDCAVLVGNSIKNATWDDNAAQQIGWYVDHGIGTTGGSVASASRLILVVGMVDHVFATKSL